MVAAVQNTAPMLHHLAAVVPVEVLQAVIKLQRPQEHQDKDLPEVEMAAVITPVAAVEPVDQGLLTLLTVDRECLIPFLALNIIGAEAEAEPVIQVKEGMEAKVAVEVAL